MHEEISITKRQKQILLAIYNSLKNEGYPPTFDDLKTKLNISSNQAIIDHLKALERKKLIKREEGTARGLKLLASAYHALQKIPLTQIAGVATAGPATLAIEQNEWTTLPNGYKKYDNVFVVQISGSSMINAGVYNGDSVLIKEQREYKSGDIVLARMGDDVTLKTFIAKDGATYLQPENPNYRIIPITDDTYFLGKMISNLGKR